MKRAIFGGSFNPIHKGHINLMENARKAADLDEIILMPAKIPPHKQSLDLADDRARLEMCRIASLGLDGVIVSDYEIKREDISYSVYTIRHFKSLYPNDDWYFIMGSDMLLSLHTWFEYEEILEAVTVIAATREEYELERLSEYCKTPKMSKLKCILIKEEPLVMSSTEIRERLKSGDKCPDMLDSGVAEYIINNKIY